MFVNPAEGGKEIQTRLTFEEHQKIVSTETNAERRHYYELLWEIGASQTDAAYAKKAHVILPSLEGYKRANQPLLPLFAALSKNPTCEAKIQIAGAVSPIRGQMET